MASSRKRWPLILDFAFVMGARQAWTMSLPFQSPRLRQNLSGASLTCVSADGIGKENRQDLPLLGLLRCTAPYAAPYTGRCSVPYSHVRHFTVLYGAVQTRYGLFERFSTVRRGLLRS
jgi:hypothetical protein